MNCPRCGRPVGENANFCGGCGLPMADIIRMNAENDAGSNSDSEYYTTDADTSTTEADENTAAEESASETDTHTSGNAGYTSAESSQSGSYTRNAGEKPEKEEKREKAWDDTPLSMTDYLIMDIIALIPVVGLIYLVYTAIMSGNTNKSAYAKARLITIAFLAIGGFLFFAGTIVRMLYWLW